MTKAKLARSRQPVADDASTAVVAGNVAPKTTVETPKRWLEMRTSLCGPQISLSRGDKHQFDDVAGQDGAPSEAQRLIDAGFAVDCDPPA